MKRLFLMSLLAGVAVSLVAQTDQWEFRFGPRFWGPTIAGRYVLSPPEQDDVETSVTALLSTAGESAGYYRNPDGSLYELPVAPDDPAAEQYAGIGQYRRYDLVWQLGIQQGILPRYDVPQDRAVAFLLYRGQYDLPRRESEYLLFKGAANADGAQELFFRSGRPEVGGSLRGSVVGGLAYSTIESDERTRSQQGVEAEVALEWGPSLLHNQILARADYTRSTLKARGFLPLFDVRPDGGPSVATGYLAALGVVDWATGRQIPLDIRGTTGGRSIRSAPGGSVRGYASRRFDSTLKFVGNAEFRMTFPSLPTPWLVPGLLVYTDGAYYLDEEATSPVAAENSGLLLSSGLGLSTHLDLAVFSFELVFYTNYVWTETTFEGENWVPFGLGFGLHF